jgi:hypothetical protein
MGLHNHISRLEGFSSVNPSNFKLQLQTSLKLSFFDIKTLLTFATIFPGELVLAWNVFGIILERSLI